MQSIVLGTQRYHSYLTFHRVVLNKATRALCGEENAPHFGSHKMTPVFGGVDIA